MAIILVVDDEKQVREVLGELLGQDGHEVIMAADGIDALEVLNKDVELVISDLIMPRKTGADFVKEVRHTYPHIPVLLISGGGNLKGTLNDSELSASWLETELVIRKPFHGDEIRMVVNSMLSDDLSTVSGE